ncbi:MAG: FAD-dependent oxidoreductase [Victivallaceae bacterium]|nr:FAD-dependent oxidoreductase [Victivallaceae bacterium]
MQKKIKEESRELPVIGSYEVVVAGGGIAGIAAAVAAARNGAKTLIIERYGFLGGTVVSCPMPVVGGYNPEVHTGIMTEIIELLRKNDGVNREFYNEVIGGQMIEVRLDVLKEIAVEMILNAGGDILFHTWISEVMVKNKEIAGIIIESKSGRQAVLAKVVIDTTGDGDIAALAGAAFEVGRKSDGKTQAMTLYGPIMDGVDINKLLSFIREYKKTNPGEILEFIDEENVFAMSGFVSMIKNAREKGDLKLDYNTIWLNGKKDEGWAELSGSFVPDVSGTEVKDLTRAEIDSIRQISSMVSFVKKYVPGFEKARRRDRGSVCIGVRETRRIIGNYILTQDDLVGQRSFADVVARNSTAIDIHTPEGKQNWVRLKAYDIPYRCLISKDMGNLLMAGRCISVTHEALASVRFIPCCVVTGEAAGTAAALAVKQNISPVNIDVPLLQKMLNIHPGSTNGN